MDCTKCELKGCRKHRPCNDRSGQYIDEYRNDDNRLTVKAASELIDGGRAGTLNRLEEIAEYVKLRGYRKIGVAYCYGLEKEAVMLREYLEGNALLPVMISCTVDGVRESDIDPGKFCDSVSCNPIGQANALNSAQVDFTILMGLCLGHDILLQKNLQTDFTTFIVKDRMLKHNPLLALSDKTLPEDTFLEGLGSDFNLIKVDDFKLKLQEWKSPDDFYLLDLRAPEAYNKDGLTGSTNCSLNSLPKRYKALFPNKSKEIIVCCSGGIQSVYAVMFLSLKGYKDVKSLAGGLSKFQQDK
jgi:uncharacterized metal-binding protein/rhodanese-related sulfurtransferase